MEAINPAAAGRFQHAAPMLFTASEMKVTPCAFSYSTDQQKKNQNAALIPLIIQPFNTNNTDQHWSKSLSCDYQRFMHSILKNANIKHRSCQMTTLWGKKNSFTFFFIHQRQINDVLLSIKSDPLAWKMC